MKKYKEIVFNGKYMCRKECRGTQRYTKEVLHALDKIVPPNTVKIIVPHKCFELDHFKNISIVKFGGFLTSKFWQILGFQIYIWKNKAFSICLSDGVPFFQIGMVTIHDIRYLEDLKKDISFKVRLGLLFNKYTLKNAIKKSKKIITVSEFSKNELIKYYNIIDSDKIDVCYCSWQHINNVSISNDILLKNSLLKKGNFYFTLGGSV